MPKDPETTKIYSVLQEMLRRSSSELNRLRELEQRMDSLESRLSSLEETSAARIRKSNEKFVFIDATMKTIGDQILHMKNNLEKINRQISKFARKRDVQELEKMFELLSPLKQEFVTKRELEQELHPRE